MTDPRTQAMRRLAAEARNFAEAVDERADSLRAFLALSCVRRALDEYEKASLEADRRAQEEATR